MSQPSEVAKADEIMARYRPIAPKLPLAQLPPPLNSSISMHAPPMRSMALCLKGKPVIARKRGRASQRSGFVPVPMTPMTLKTIYPSVKSSSMSVVATMVRAHCPLAPTGLAHTLSLAPRCPAELQQKPLRIFSFPSTSSEVGRGIPMEKDLIQKLQEVKVIIPEPMRPVDSRVTICCIILHTNNVREAAPIYNKPEEVEEEVESDTLPILVSDSRNRVRLANNAYKEMVGQPECPWLDVVVTTKTWDSASRKINGEVVLDVPDYSVLMSSNGFSCKATIQWACKGRRTLVIVPCDVSRLCCESKDYLFTWRFRTPEASVTYSSA